MPGATAGCGVLTQLTPHQTMKTVAFNNTQSTQARAYAWILRVVTNQGEAQRKIRDYAQLDEATKRLVKRGIMALPLGQLLMMAGCQISKKRSDNLQHLERVSARYADRLPEARQG